MDNLDNVIVVECCENCRQHNWNTRHDPNKYEEFFQNMSSAIQAKFPQAQVIKNTVPKAWADMEAYC